MSYQLGFDNSWRGKLQKNEFEMIDCIASFHVHLLIAS